MKSPTIGYQSTVANNNVLTEPVPVPLTPPPQPTPAPQNSSGKNMPLIDPNLINQLSPEEFNAYLGSLDALVSEKQNTGGGIQQFSEVTTSRRDIPGIKTLESKSSKLDKEAITKTKELKDIEEGYNKQVVALQEQAMEEYQFQQKQLDAERARIEQIQKAKTDVTRLNENIKNFKLDPNRLMGNNTMNKVWASLAVGLAYGASSQAGIEMSKSIDRMIENDLALQQEELQKMIDGRKYAENAITAAYKTFGDEVSATELIKSIIYKNIADKIEMNAVKDGTRNKLNNELLINSLNKKAIDNQLAYAEKQAVTIGTKPLFASSAEANKDKWAAEDSLRRELMKDNPQLQEYFTVANRDDQLQAVDPNNATGPEQILALFNFLTSLDPKSVVRESELKLAGNGMTIGEWLSKNGSRLLAGEAGLVSSSYIRKIQDVSARNRAVSFQTNVAPRYKMIAEIVKKRELDPKAVLMFLDVPSYLKKQGVKK